jgi:hypothetical protein
MARRGSFSVQKRLREAKKRQKKLEKDEKKDYRKENKGTGDDDADIAEIVPGPQAPPEQFRY